MVAHCPPSSSRASPATRPTPPCHLDPDNLLGIDPAESAFAPARRILFNHCLFHGTWFKWPERVYLAAKCAARPRTAEQFRLYDDYYRIDATDAGLAGR